MTDGGGSLVPDDAFSDLPEKLRAELLEAFNSIVTNFAERRWEPAELNGGKLCEVAYRICEGYVNGRYPSSATKPRNFPAACQKLEQADSKKFPRSIRIQIPRMLIPLYEVRNNRNVGHVGGDVDPNHMDAVCVLQMSKWVMAELIRVLHNLSLDEASDVVDALVERDIPLVWEMDDVKRVLDPKMPMKQKTLILLHSEAGWVDESDLCRWVEHSNASVYRRDVLWKAHKDKLIEYDEAARRAILLPPGVAKAEEIIREHGI